MWWWGPGANANAIAAPRELASEVMAVAVVLSATCSRSYAVAAVCRCSSYTVAAVLL